MAALSPAAPTRPMDPTRWLTARARTYFLDRNWLPLSEWTTHPATPAGPPRPGHGGGQGVNGELGLHPVADRVANDPVGEDVLDRAAVDLALVGAVSVM